MRQEDNEEWTKGENNIGIKEDIVYITATTNPAGFKEVTEEDNQDKVTVLLSVSTGELEGVQYIVATITISILILGVLTLHRKRK